MERGSRSTKKTDTQGAGSCELKTRAVLFVEQTPMGELARRIREQVNSMGSTLGFKLKVVERTGRNLLTNFPQTKTWGGLQWED